MGEVSNAFVVIMGIGTVFIGLICIVLLCKIISLLCRAANNKDKEVTAAHATCAPALGVPKEAIANRGEVVAAISAAIAEELGTDVTGIRILSIKKI